MNSVDWNGRMEWWSGLLSGVLDWTTGGGVVVPLYACVMLL